MGISGGRNRKQQLFEQSVQQQNDRRMACSLITGLIKSSSIDYVREDIESHYDNVCVIENLEDDVYDLEDQVWIIVNR